MLTFKEFLSEAAAEPVLKMRVTKHPDAKRGVYSPTGTFVVDEIQWNHGGNPDSMFVSYKDDAGHTNGWNFDRKDPPKFIKYMLGSQVLDLKQAMAQMKKQGKDGKVTVHGGEPTDESVGVPNPTAATKKDAKMATAVVAGYRKHVKTSGFNQSYAKKHPKEVNEAVKAKLRVRVRKHPMGLYQPTGTFTVLSLKKNSDGANVMRIDDGDKNPGGWTFRGTKAPAFMTLLANGSEITLAQAYKIMNDEVSENLTEGKHVVKNKAGVEKRFTPGPGGNLSDEAQAWKNSEGKKPAVKHEAYSQGYWEAKEDRDGDAIVPWTMISPDEVNDQMKRILRDAGFKHAEDWHYMKKGSTVIDGVHCATLDIRVAFSFDKDDDLGLDDQDGPVEDSQYIRVARDSKSPKTVKFLKYIG